MYLLGESVVLDWYTQNSAGVDTNCDSTPSVQVTGPGVIGGTCSTVNVGTGHYRSTHTPTKAGVHAYKFTGVIGGVTVVQVKPRTVRDGVSEALGTTPDGMASWVPNV